MKINTLVMPLHIRGVCDMDTNTIILSSNQSPQQFKDTFVHELSHLLVRDKNHSRRWLECYQRFGGSAPYNVEFDRLFSNVGYMPNIGNISGIQNIYY